ncbi:hypothetical protein C2857_005543 [Epichloe festucae Fl1]|uniref:Transfer RNA methyltransferase 82 n=1 Tax=Epichloe festucae (strain Fl1) TaxID=877507 RepID=A0A7S9PW16_EPIFF|nr:hypothetical protein C2857_005543 [Epichloe festucae Fl1]
MSLTAIPYNRVQTTRNILFATRGGKIHSFNLSDSTHLSTWQHPDVEKFANACNKDNSKPQNGTGDAPAAPETGKEASEPPAKRQKTAQGEELNAPPDNVEDSKAGEASQNRGMKQGKKKGKKQSKGPSHGDKSRMGRVVDRPLITLMTCTSDGQHLVAVSGHDKAVWVFEHNGHGRLTQLSQRVMPKRPSSITLGFGPQIIVADKFGDVYSLPLLMTPLSPSSLAVRTAVTPSSLGTKPAVPAANTLTVHSKRNRAALEHQRKQLESEKAKAGDASKSEGPSFELTLLLGHVSMLTSLVVAESQGKKYILTADRDEHIRVSRYIPQAHIIEAFCLGHKEFISEIIIPLGQGNVLISGGGDEDLIVWDWKAGFILSRTNLLSLAREIVPQTSKIAVSGLTSLLYPSDEGQLTYVLAICEDFKAIFTWQLIDGNQLKNPSIIQLPCNPLHITTTASPSSPSDDSPPKLIVAMDPGRNTEARSLHEYTLTRSEGRLSSDVELILHGQTADDAEMQVSEKDILNMFYNVENLRKQQDGEEGEDGEDGGSAAPEDGEPEILANPAAAQD